MKAAFYGKLMFHSLLGQFCYFGILDASTLIVIFTQILNFGNNIAFSLDLRKSTRSYSY